MLYHTDAQRKTYDAYRAGAVMKRTQHISMFKTFDTFKSNKDSTTNI